MFVLLILYDITLNVFQGILIPLLENKLLRGMVILYFLLRSKLEYHNLKLPYDCYCGSGVYFIFIDYQNIQNYRLKIDPY